MLILFLWSVLSVQRQAVILNASVPTGAFGTAVLYRKVADDTLVVIKEVNMIDLTATERQMALNEVQVLSSLDHPNIIR
jgi:NIMA (never in mitosis gene a)-related kinase